MSRPDREELTAYFESRADLPRMQRDQILAKIASASEESIDSDRPCVGKHWFLMSATDRDICPFCGWKLTLRKDAIA